MALKQPKLPEGAPRRQGHETTYQASRGGYYPAKDKPVPGTPKPKKG
ncbi:hypothetical protein [Streptomyces lunaelactis]|nr:hypothetical protein [Streptomyces lunaelactis]NUK22056.1 hypothetical protein [Streptomyces lunaelactis]